MATYLSEVWTRKARKKHLCNGCGKLIQEGEPYHSVVMVDAGDLYQFKTCKKCKSFSKEYPELCYEDGITEEGWIGEALQDWEAKNGEYKIKEA